MDLGLEESVKILNQIGLNQRRHHIIYKVSSGEFAIPMELTGNAMEMQLIPKEEILEELSKLREEVATTMKWIHIGTIEVLIKATFKKGIDSEIHLSIMDRRINNLRDGCLGTMIGNLYAGKLMFDIHPRIAYNLADQDFSRVLTLHQNFKRKYLMKEGNRPYSITYRIAYALSNTHHSDLFLRKEYIEIPRIFKEFAKVMTPDPIRIPRIGGVDIVIKDHPVLERTLSTRTEFSSRMSFSEDRITGYRGKERELIKTFTPQEIRIDNVKLRCPEGWKEIQVILDITERENYFPCDDLYHLQQPVIGRYEGMLEIAGHEILVADIAGREHETMILGSNFLENHKPWGRKGSGICTAKPGVFPKEAVETLPVIAGRDFSQKILILNKGIREAKIMIGGAFGTPWFRVLRREKAFNRIMPINFRSKRGDFDAKFTHPKMQDRRRFGKTLLSFRQQGLIDSDSFYKESEEEIKNLKEALQEIKLLDISEESKLSLENVKRLIQRNFSENPLAWWDRNKIEATLKVMKECKYEYVRYKPIQMNMEDNKDMQMIIKEHINLGLIEPEVSAYSSPDFLVRNRGEIKRGKPRLVINYQGINKILEFDGYYIPSRLHLIDCIKGAKVFSKFDCKSSFYQIKMENESKKFTAFSTPQGQYIWNVLPMGLANAPQIFQRKMDNLFKDYFEFMFVYIDDILIASKNMKDHIKHLEIFSDACHKEGLVLSEKKATIAVNKIEFLGILIDETGIELQEHIVEKIRNFPDILKDKKHLQSFLGVVNFAGIFIKDLAKYRKDFRPLLKETESSKWKWEEIHTQRVRELKQVCSNLPKLAIPQDEDELVVYTDANDYRWAAVLMKKTTTGEEPCRYTGGLFSEQQAQVAGQVQRADLDIVQTTIRSSLVASTALWNALQEPIRKASPSLVTRELREYDPKHAFRVQGSRPVAADSSTACTRPSLDSDENGNNRATGSAKPLMIRVNPAPLG
ncbi:UNVERIFIED_CONTAM: Enzymatic polyprotein [Sesamum radiatum]|uniref:Enzymatic polyprotein n=1 Tax=Sesamum radiatum TaxID=300843 RepID=A0AAW2W3W4_SESRA